MRSAERQYLEREAQDHKRAIRHHRRRLREIMEHISREAGVPITINGVAQEVPPHGRNPHDSD